MALGTGVALRALRRRHAHDHVGKLSQRQAVLDGHAGIIDKLERVVDQPVRPDPGVELLALASMSAANLRQIRPVTGIARHDQVVAGIGTGVDRRVDHEVAEGIRGRRAEQCVVAVESAVRADIQILGGGHLQRAGGGDPGLARSTGQHTQRIDRRAVDHMHVDQCAAQLVA